MADWRIVVRTGTDLCTLGLLEPWPSTCQSTELEDPRSGTVAGTRRPYRHRAPARKPNPLWRWSTAGTARSLSHERPKRVSRADGGREDPWLADMQIEEVGVGYVTSLERAVRVGETFRYFTIILPRCLGSMSPGSRRKNAGDSPVAAGSAPRMIVYDGLDVPLDNRYRGMARFTRTGGLTVIRCFPG